MCLTYINIFLYFFIKHILKNRKIFKKPKQKISIVLEKIFDYFLIKYHIFLCLKKILFFILIGFFLMTFVRIFIAGTGTFNNETILTHNLIFTFNNI